jgi:hypothetical protein
VELVDLHANWTYPWRFSSVSHASSSNSPIDVS